MQQPSPTQSQHADIPLPEAQEVVHGIWKITLPIPFPLKTVNVYALVGHDGWVLVDAGMGTPEARRALNDGLEKAGLALPQLKKLVLTHHHPDHIGLSGELQEQSGAQVYMHPIDEQNLATLRDGTMPKRFGSVSNFFSQHGLENTKLWYNQTNPEQIRRILCVPPHEAFTLVEDGASLELADEIYQVFWVPGHSDGQIVLFRPRDGVFLAADHVLPRITPNIGLYSERDRPDPLNDYLLSLRKVEHLPASLVLPGHGEPFANLGERVREIAQHHQERLAGILALLEQQPRHAAEITQELFPSRRIQNHEALRMAMAEILAHLEYLRINGQVKQIRTDEGIILYARSH